MARVGNGLLLVGGYLCLPRERERAKESREVFVGVYPYLPTVPLKHFVYYALEIENSNHDNRSLTHLDEKTRIEIFLIVSFKITALHFSLLDYKIHQLLVVLTSL